MKQQTDGERIVKLANALGEEIKLWDANQRQLHRPAITKLIDKLCTELAKVAIGNTPI